MTTAPPLTSSRRIAGGHVLRPGAVAPYRALRVVAGEAHTLRSELAPSVRVDVGNGHTRPLACLVHITDLQLADVQSPARFEFFNREFGDRRFDALLPVQRPHEAITGHVVEAMVRTINRTPAGPLSGHPLELVVTSGDAIDNAQWNELLAFLALLEGGVVELDSGGPRFEGVQGPQWADDIFWIPDGGRNGPDLFTRDYGFPRLPGLLARALRPIRATGLDLPWLGCYGNHEALLQGFGKVTPELARALVGAVKPARATEDLDRDTALETFARGAEAFLEGPGVAVTPDSARRPVTRREFVTAHLSPTARPAGHGFTQANQRADTAYYAHDTPTVRYIALDTASTAGGPDGRVDGVQLAWLEERLIEVSSAYRTRDGAQIRTAHEDRLVVVFSHHGLDTLTNQRDRHGPSGQLEPDAAQVLAMLHRFDNVVLWLTGHTHSSQIRARPHPLGRGRGFWEVTTCSIVDWPCQARIVEIIDIGDGMLAIACTMLDHDSPVEASGPADRVDLAALHRELAANVPWAGLQWRGAGDRGDRNVILPLRAPFPLSQLPVR